MRKHSHVEEWEKAVISLAGRMPLCHPPCSHSLLAECLVCSPRRAGLWSTCSSSSSWLSICCSYFTRQTTSEAAAHASAEGAPHSLLPPGLTGTGCVDFRGALFSPTCPAKTPCWVTQQVWTSRCSAERTTGHVRAVVTNKITLTTSFIYPLIEFQFEVYNSVCSGVISKEGYFSNISVSLLKWGEIRLLSWPGSFECVKAISLCGEGGTALCVHYQA